MMFIPGQRVEMRVLALLLIVYFMSLTWTVVSSDTNTPASPASIATIIASISPTTSKPTTTSSTSTPPTTSTPPPSTLTQLPLEQPTPAPSLSGRKFDAASFVGGIILGIVLAIIFVLVFKWWQSRNKSYHSL